MYSQVIITGVFVCHNWKHVSKRADFLKEVGLRTEQSRPTERESAAGSIDASEFSLKYTSSAMGTRNNLIPSS